MSFERSRQCQLPIRGRRGLWFFGAASAVVRVFAKNAGEKGDQQMKRRIIEGTSIVGWIAVFALGVLHAQQHPAGHQHPAAQTQAAPSSEAPATIFCPTMKTGQLCSHGTADALALSDAKREAWIAAARRYNQAVDEATKQLQAEAKSLLTPAELAEVERWFAKGLNPQINDLLRASTKRTRE